ncbi:MAG: DUF6102 family protein [Clostridiales bacterium]|nr:DUF6102 family protein [Clostridiales bacterium]
MEWILIGLIVATIMGSQFIVDAMLNSLIPMAFYAEQYINTSIGGGALDFSGLYTLFFGFGVSLIVLKFMKKGFDVYIGWTDGDPDLDPLALVTNFLRAMAVALCFPILYDALITATTDMIDQTIVIIDQLMEQQSIVDELINLISDSIFMALAGLIDSDKGIFAPYAKKFFMNAATVLIQIVLVKLSLTIMVLGNPFYSLAIVFVAMRTPKFLQEFVVQMGGAGGSIVNSVYHTSRLVQMAKSVGKR